VVDREEPSMTADLAPTLDRVPERLGHRDRHRLRRRLDHQDRVSAQRAELHRIGELLAEARRIVDAGWVRGAWFVHRSGGTLRSVPSAHLAGRLGDGPVVAACLVGAVVQAGGGMSAAGSQPVQRALDLTWHTLFGDGRDPVRWCPAPPVRAAHVRDLTRWNDDPRRTRQQVAELLDRSAAAARAQLATVT
jgi:hypothetical protein